MSVADTSVSGNEPEETLDLGHAGRSGRNTAAPRSPRRRAREFAVQGIYQALLSGHDATNVLSHLQQMEGYKRADAALLSVLVQGVLSGRSALQAQIEPLLNNRNFAELAPVEAAVLLLGAYELVYMHETPRRVVLNECVELTKTFGGTGGHRYVNGVLDKLSAKLRAEV